VIGTAGSLLRAASSFLGGWGSSAGDSAYEIQRAVGGKAHDSALETAVKEGKEHFHQCLRCGKWVCPDVCWNEQVEQCGACAPDFQQEAASAHAQAKAEAAREQLFEKARKTDFAGDIDMRAGSVVHSIDKGSAKPRFCPECGTKVTAKFCPECGTGTTSHTVCLQCGHDAGATVKFCPECGGNMPRSRR
jgi:membrane protease subunit (stomatin/prohibitin family)